MMKRHEALEILGLTGNPTEKEVIIAYRKQALKKHPDKGGSKEAFQELGTAKALLDNPTENLEPMPAENPGASHKPKHSREQSDFSSRGAPAFSKRTDAEILEQIKREDKERQQRARRAAEKSAAATKNGLDYIHNLLYRSLSPNDFDAIWLKSEMRIRFFVYSPRPLKHYPHFIDDLKTLPEIKLQILSVFLQMFDPTDRENRTVVITINQTLIDTLLDRSTNLDELYEVLSCLKLYQKLNISSMDLILNQPLYLTIIKEVFEKFYDFELAEDDRAMGKHLDQVLDFFSHFSPMDMASIDFEEEIKTATAETILATMAKFNAILRQRKRENEEAKKTELFAQEGMKTSVETMDDNAPSQAKVLSQPIQTIFSSAPASHSPLPDVEKKPSIPSDNFAPKEPASSLPVASGLVLPDVEKKLSSAFDNFTPKEPASSSPAVSSCVLGDVEPTPSSSSDNSSPKEPASSSPAASSRVLPDLEEKSSIASEPLKPAAPTTCYGFLLKALTVSLSLCLLTAAAVLFPPLGLSAGLGFVLTPMAGYAASGLTAALGGLGFFSVFKSEKEDVESPANVRSM